MRHQPGQGPSPTAGAIPVRALLGLGAGVLLAHWVVLQNTSLAPDVRETVATRAFTTRTLRINPVPTRPEPRVIRRPQSRVNRAVTPVARMPPAREQAPAVVTAPPMEPAPEVVPPIVDVLAQAVVPESAPTTPSEPAATEPGAPTPAEPAATEAGAPTIPGPAMPAASEPAPREGAAAAPMPKDAALEARAYTVPGSVRLQFNATGQRGRLTYYARGELSWLLREDNAYEATMQLGAFLIGSRTVTSVGRVTADGLAPTRFSDKYRANLAAHFDRDNGRVIFSANTPEAALLAGAQDQLSVFVQLASMLAAEPLRYPRGASIAIQTVGTRSAETRGFTVEAEETLELPGGELATIKLVHHPRKGKEYDQKFEIWLAPALAYLPARIRVTNANGDFIDQQWRATAAP